MSNLYELSYDYRRTAEFLDQAEDETELKYALDLISELEVALESKVENTAKLIKSFEAEADKFKAEAKRLSDKSTSYANKAKSLKQWIYDSFHQNGIDRIKGDLFTVALQNNPVSLDIQSEDKIPKEYLIEQQPKIDRRALLKDMKEHGVYVEGVNLKQDKHVRIR